MRSSELASTGSGARSGISAAIDTITLRRMLMRCLPEVALTLQHRQFLLADERRRPQLVEVHAPCHCPAVVARSVPVQAVLAGGELPVRKGPHQAPGHVV